MTKFELKKMNPGPGADSDELAKVILARYGLIPRKKDAKAGFHKLLLQLYEKKKAAGREKKPEMAVMTVEEMGLYAGIKRQTMYDYLRRWMMLNVLKKTTFVQNGDVTTGYELNGPNIEAAFSKANDQIHMHLEQSSDFIKELQNEIKKEKLRGNFKPEEDKETEEIKENFEAKSIPEF